MVAPNWTISATEFCKITETKFRFCFYPYWYVQLSDTKKCFVYTCKEFQIYLKT